jgi:hypothetical protein
MMERFSHDHQRIRVDGDVGKVSIIELPAAGRGAAAGEAVAVVRNADDRRLPNTRD